MKAKVLPTSHFFYRKVTVERPLRLRFDLTAERVAAFAEDSSQQKLKDGGVLLSVIGSILKKAGSRTYMSADVFRAELQDSSSAALNAGEKPTKLKVKQFEVARKFFGVRDKKAEITTNEKGDILPDSELRDAEYIPFSVLDSAKDVMSGIQSYFDAEVKPHWPDAWVDTEAADKADGQIGIVGCEINFNREFYVYTPPRSREEIRGKIEVMEQRFMDMLRGIAG